MFNIAKNLNKYKNIKIFNSRTKYIRENLIEEELSKNICFFLDAHLCQDHIINKKTYGEENNGTPILTELKIIEEQLIILTR